MELHHRQSTGKTSNLFTNPKKDGEVRSFYAARAKATANDPLAFALESLLWQGSLFVNSGLPGVMKDACKIYGLDVQKIEAAAKEKPAKIEPEGNPPLPVHSLKKTSGKSVVATK